MNGKSASGRAQRFRPDPALLILAVALALPADHAAAAKGKTEKRALVSAGKTRIYYRYVPSGVKAGRPAPLLVTLHGSGGNGWALVYKWRKFAEKEGIVLVGPDSTNPEVWNIDNDGPAFLHDVVEETRRQVPIDGRRIHLFGHSAGAVFALEIAALESEYFAAAAAHAGALESQYYSVFQYATRKTPIFLIVGTRDVLFPLPSVRATRDALAERGFPVELRELWNHNHNYYVRSREVNRYAWEFLSRHALGDEPKYKQYRR
ncbi:MAG TPA: dienelactone hydrolase family protein [Thermoanaerobaculia bacterium]|nr:dienelactone hydrolase family protein [Thermoanaerobaculia bacterium]